eukprot:scaffold645028_cov39-Prasinocladus_malaysianus.AAC.1
MTPKTLQKCLPVLRGSDSVRQVPLWLFISTLADHLGPAAARSSSSGRHRLFAADCGWVGYELTACQTWVSDAQSLGGGRLPGSCARLSHPFRQIAAQCKGQAVC